MTGIASESKLSGVEAALDSENQTLSVVKTNSNATLVDGIAEFTAVLNETTGYYQFVWDEKYLTANSTGNGVTLETEAGDYSYWQIFTATEAGKYTVKNVNATYTDKNSNVCPIYLEYYNGCFTTYSMYPNSKEAPYQMSFYSAPTITDEVVPETPEDDVVTPEEAAPLVTTLAEGDVVVIHYPASNLAITTTADGSKLTGADVTPVNGALTSWAGAAELIVSVDNNGYYSFITEDGKYLTSGETGSSLVFADTASDYSLWTLENATNGYLIKNVNAKYNSTSPQYIEYYNGFTTYSYKSSQAAAYTFNFYKVAEGKTPVKIDPVDSTYTATVAKWAGGMNSTNYTATSVYGDIYTDNDYLDTESKYTVVLDGAEAPVYTDPNKAENNHYMGASNFGANDYMQFETSSLGYGNMDMSFRMRVTKASPAEYTVQYSTDGVNFANFTTGSYSAKYTVYTSDSSSEAEYNGTISNGVLPFTSGVASAGAYVTFNLDVPAVASNAEKLYIRIVGGATKASGASGEPSGNIRIDSVVISGNPVVTDAICGYVAATPVSGGAAIGSELVLTSATEGATIYYAINGGEYKVYDAANKPVLETLPANVAAYATKEGMTNSITTYHTYTQLQCEMIKATPNGGAVAEGTKVTLRCNTEDATIMYAYAADEKVADADLTWNVYSEQISLNTLPATLKVKATKEGYLDSAVSTLSFTKRENETYNIYFGQLHSHTNYSDGAGSCEEAFAYAVNVDNLDFLAVTDHSNSLDNADNSVITQNVDTDASQEWTQGHLLAEQYSTDDFTCIYGYEMTWSNGLGHMNTFNTEGFQSRTQADYKTYGTALQNYYAALNTAPDSLSMFNHPGTTFGDFSDFAHYSEANDALITMIEVGNGEGTIGSSGYFPSYEYYTRALDKGWHVSPTNNQDNHKGKWGDANTARSVVLADSNTEENIYDAMRNNRMYATEDNNLSIYYTLDGYIMGTVLEEDQVGDNVEIKLDLSDADTTDTIGKVEVIVNGGLSIANTKVNTNEQVVTFNVPANYSYYYIKVTEGDGDIAVTSPVWVGEVESCGINATYTNEALAVSGEALDVNIDFYNNEETDLTIDAIEVSIDNKVIHSASKEALAEAGVATVASMKTATYSFDYAYEGLGSTTYDITVYATLDGVSKIYKDVLVLSYTTPDLVTNVIIDGSHYNDYVTGYYGGNMGAFIDICADKNIKAVIDTDGITAEELENCALLIVSAPGKKTGTANAGEYTVSHFEDSFIQMVSDYVANGGSVIACGLADYQDSTDCQTATEMNKLLAAIGSTIRVNSDEGYDEVNNGGQAYRLYLENYDASSEWLAGVVDGQQYSAYSGCTVNVTGAVENDVVYAANALVTGFDTTYSIDCKTDDGAKVDGSPVYVEKGNVVEFAHQATKAGGNIFVSGTVFMSDFEVEAEIDNNDSLPYMNYNIISNILASVEKQLPVSTIAEARQGDIGDFFAVEGYVTSGTSNEYTTFFDSIYIQDATGGICVFPFAEAGLELGTKMRITGYIDEYQGEKEIQIISYKILDEEPYVYEAKEITTAQATDYDTFGGQLVKVTGTVTRVELTSDGLGIAEYWVKDASGVEAAVFIDGYILSGTTGTNTLASFVKEGAIVSGVGVLYKHPEGNSDVSVPVLRVRNCDEIVLVSGSSSESGGSTGNSGSTENNGSTGDNGSANNAGSNNNNSASGNSNWVDVVVNNANAWNQVSITIASVKDGSNVVVELKGNTTITASVLQTLKGRNVNLVMKLENGISWTINGTTITNATLGNIDFGVALNTNVIPDNLISKIAGAKQTIEFSLNHNGEFGCTAQMTMNVGAENSGKYAKLYYYNPQTGKLEFQMNGVIGADGNTTLSFTHASDYVIVIDTVATVATGDTASFAGIILLLFGGVLVLAVAFRRRRTTM
ncbi:MAG: CehA/McbA family metallohydrolase [Clostridia bacterium]|nr:CehA/McbA family metallohydrolase [Clostridia bacterium]